MHTSEALRPTAAASRPRRSPPAATPLAAYLAAATASEDPTLAPLLQQLRQQGLTRLQQLDVPTPRSETFRHMPRHFFTALAAALASTAGLQRSALSAPHPDLTREALPASIWKTDLAPACRLVCLNGQWRSDLGSPAAQLQQAGVQWRSLAAACAAPPAWLPALASLPPLQDVAPEQRPTQFFPSLNLAFCGDGLVVELTAPANLEVLYLTDGSAAPTLPWRQPHLLLHLATNCEARLLERHMQLPTSAAPTATPPWTNALSQISLAPAAQLAYSVLQHAAPEAKGAHLAHSYLSLQAAARCRSLSSCSGALLTRQQLHVALQAPEATIELYGLTLGAAQQQHSLEVEVQHRAPQTHSQQYFKTLLTEQAQSAFRGTVQVARHACGSVAQQLQKNLLLSPQATAHTQPRLAILNHDVVCKHGATVSQLGEEALFYCQSRGIGSAAARQLLASAFAQDVLAPSKSSDPALHAALQQQLQRWFAALAVA